MSAAPRARGAASLPPGPTAPSAVQTVRWAARPVPFMAECRARHGDVFTVRMAIGTFVFVADHRELKAIFTADPEHLRAGAANVPLAPMVGRSSLLLLDGAEHLRQRRLLLPPFHGERMAAYFELMRRVTEEAVGRWPADRPFALQPEMQALTLEIILQAVFGLTEERRRDEVARALIHLLGVATGPAVMLPWLRRDLGPGSPWRRFVAARAEVDRLLYEEIARARRDPALSEREDILALMVGARYEDGEGMTDEEVRDELVTLLVAGHETTATTLAWAFERLFRHPTAFARLREEAREPESDGAYADAVVKETLRLRPVILWWPAWSPARPSPWASGRSRPGCGSRRASTSSTATPRSTPSRWPSGPSASSARSPAPTRGFPSGAGCAAAWAPPSRRPR